MLFMEKIQNVFPRAADIPQALLNGIPCLEGFFHSNTGCGQGNGFEQTDYHPHRA